MTEQPRDPEARIIYALCVGISLPFVVAAFVRRQTIGAGTTICMVIASLGMVGLAVEWLRRPRVPRARVVSYTEPARTGLHPTVIDNAEPSVEGRTGYQSGDAPAAGPRSSVERVGR
jgi:hypothetical protein